MLAVLKPVSIASNKLRKYHSCAAKIWEECIRKQVKIEPTLDKVKLQLF